MSNPWPKVVNTAPPGYEPNAVALVRQAHKLKGFEMVRRLGINATELSECENKEAPRWPKSNNARQKLIEMANEVDLDIGQRQVTQPQEEIASLF
jgi:hypothetical protein